MSDLRQVRVVVLGGTGEARVLCALLGRRGVATVASLAGATRAPLSYPVPVRRGGFGGRAGYEAWLDACAPRLVVDALHPFAQTMRARLLDVATTRSEPILHLTRPAWRAQPGDRWTAFATPCDAAQALPPGAKPLLTIGRKDWQAVSQHISQGVLRSIEPVEGLPPTLSWLQDRPPFTLEGELEVMRQMGITHLMTKNAGGAQTAAKLHAARTLGLPVFIVERPRVASPHPRVHSPDAALAFCDMVLGR
ncbi:MAG: precorrin-6A/cobalt-precorrin-6A reductase [Pseudomonadota bacterium]